MGRRCLVGQSGAWSSVLSSLLLPEGVGLCTIIMNVGKFDLFYFNKQWESPLLGHVDCKLLSTNFKECMENVGIKNSQIYCLEIFELVNKCYKAKDETDFNSWVDAKLKTRRRLIDHLNSRQSAIPQELKKHNTWGIFDPFSRRPDKKKEQAEPLNEQKLVEDMRLINEITK